MADAVLAGRMRALTGSAVQAGAAISTEEVPAHVRDQPDAVWGHGERGWCAMRMQHGGTVQAATTSHTAQPALLMYHGCLRFQATLVLPAMFCALHQPPKRANLGISKHSPGVQRSWKVLGSVASAPRSH
jgi:hypothetical protein